MRPAKTGQKQCIIISAVCAVLRLPILRCSTRVTGVAAHRKVPVARPSARVPHSLLSVNNLRSLPSIIVTSSGADQGRVNPGSIPRRKFGSGDPHTQTGEDAQATVTGSDEMKAGEAAPKAMEDLVYDVKRQQEEAMREARSGGGGGDGESGGGLEGYGAERNVRPAEGAAATNDAYGSTE